jgi:hypothetical protein
MTKEEVIDLMCKTVEEYNREMAINQKVDAAEIDQYLDAVRPQLEYINSYLYSTLKAHGVIY